MADTLEIEVLSWLFCIVFAGLFIKTRSPEHRLLKWIFVVISIISALVGLFYLVPLVFHSFRGDVSIYIPK